MPFIRRAVAAFLVSLQIVLSVPRDLQAAGVARAPEPTQVQTPAAPAVRPNRTTPPAQAAPSRPEFSAVPTDAEILRARVFPEPLVPVGPTSAQDNVALAAALNLQFDRRGSDGLGAIQRFMEARPTSAWQPSLLLNSGLVLLREGFTTRAADAFRAAWNLTKQMESRGAVAVADPAIGQLLSLESRLGHADIVEQLIADVGARALTGAATEQFSAAKQSLWVMRKAPDEAFRCGPSALFQLLLALGKSPNARLMMTRTGPEGISLARLATLVTDASVTLVPAWSDARGTFPIPSVVHFRSNHFGALLRQDGDRYLVRDITFGGDRWFSARALTEEASGAVLAVAGTLPDGWQPMTTEAAGQVWGRGQADPPPPPKKTDPKIRTVQCRPGMAAYSAYLAQVSLNVFDMPVGYSPAVGPSAWFTLMYNQRDTYQPQTFSYSNFGSLWTFDWLSYVTDDPGNANADAAVYLRGGGQITYSGYDSATGQFATELRDRTTLVRTSASPVRYELRLPDGSKEIYAQADGASGYPRRIFLTAIVDSQDNTLTLTYDGQTRLRTVTDALGLVTTLSYTHPQDPWKITQVTDPFARSASFHYDAAGRLVRIVDVIQLWSAFTYARDGFMTSLSTPYGTTRFVKSDNGGSRTLDMIDPLGGLERVEYRMADESIPSQDSAATVPTVGAATFNNDYLQYRNTLYWNREAASAGLGDWTKAQLYHWVHQKDNVNAVAPILESEKAALENRIWYLYPNQIGAGWEGDGRQPTALARVLDDGTTQAYLAAYNPQGEVTQATDPLGRQTTYSYAANGIDLTQIRQTTAGVNDVLATFTYDTHHRPLTMTDAANNTTTLTYNARGQLLTASNALSQTTTLAYDGDGHLQSVTGALPGTTYGLTPDVYGRIHTVTTPDGYVATYSYDALDRPTAIAYPDGTSRAFVYDRLDLAREKDRSGRWSTTTYDALSRPVAFTDPLGRVTLQTWCACGSLARLTDASGNTTSWDRDVMGRVTKETRADGAFTSYAYETATSRLKAVTDPKLQVKTFTYAQDDSLTGIVYTNATTATPAVTLTYDPAYPRLSRMRTTPGYDGTGVSDTDYTYVPVGTLGAGHRATVDGPLAGDGVSYAYDALGRMHTRSLGSVTTTWNYDALGRLQTEVDPIGTFTFAYDGVSGRLAQATYPNGQTSTYSYFGNSGEQRLQEIHHKTGGGATLSRFAYAYSQAGNITTWTQQYGADVKAYDFSYDSTDQLTGAVYRTTDATPAILKRYGYVYDKTGNRTTARTDDAPVLSIYNALNQITSQSGGGVLAFTGTTSEPAHVTVGGKLATGAGSAVFSGSAVLPGGTSTVAVAATDASGNTATQSYEVDVPTSTGTFTYDANGNLTAQGTKTYEWDAENRLTRVLDSGTEIARFVYDGYGRRVQKITPATTRSYVHDGMDLLQERIGTSPTDITRTVPGPGIDQPLASVDAAGTVSYYLSDHLGSIVQQTNAAGAVTLTRQYDPYGVPLQGGATSGYAFTGREWDTEIGLYYYRSRYYDPNSARFLSEDRIGFRAGVNFYPYVDGNPTNRVDPSGEDAIYIQYRNYMVDTGFGFDMPFGHAAVIAVDPKTGETKYFEYGRYGGDYGVVKGPKDRPIPNVVIGKDGKPTEASLKNLYQYVSKKWGKNSFVDDQYYADADYKKVVDFAYDRMNDKNRPPYSWNPLNRNHCFSFAHEAIAAGRK